MLKHRKIKLMNELLEEFDPISYDTWLNQLKKDLKDKSLDDLVSNPEPDLSIRAYHHRETVSASPLNTGFYKMNNDWKIRQIYSSDEEKNHIILEALNQGIEGLGLQVLAQTDFDALTKGILFEHIETDITFADLHTAISFQSPESAILNFDVIALNSTEGSNEFSLADFFAFYRAHPTNRSIWISGTIYGEAGASTVQELAYTLNHLNEYMHLLRTKGISLKEINEKIVIELTVNDNYFVNIAKFRVIHALVRHVFLQYDSAHNYTPVLIFAKTNIRHLAVNDQNNNVLRETTQAMSAVIGGCDVLTVSHLEIGSAQERARTRRIAKNIQLILKEEAYLNRVVDPSHGAYFIEDLSQQLIEKSWHLFCETENAGGLILELMANKIQTQINDNKKQLIADLMNQSKTFLGINKHPNSMEKWVDISPITPTTVPIDFEPLRPFYLENQYIKTVNTHG